MNDNCIYLIKNKITGKVYIGRTNSCIKRFSSHFSLLRKGKHPNVKIQNSYNKYGKSSFTIGIVEQNLSLEDCLKREEYYIDFYNSIVNGYNIQKGGKRERVALGSVKYWKDKKGSQHNTAKETFQYSPDGKFLKKCGSVIEAALFYKDSSSWISHCCTGKSKTCRGFYWKHEFLGNSIIIQKEKYSFSKPVLMLNFNTEEVLKEFDSMMEAERYFGKNNNKIDLVCKGKRTKWSGFKWKYKDENY